MSLPLNDSSPPKKETAISGLLYDKVFPKEIVQDMLKYVRKVCRSEINIFPRLQIGHHFCDLVPISLVTCLRLRKL